MFFGVILFVIFLSILTFVLGVLMFYKQKPTLQKIASICLVIESIFLSYIHFISLSSNFISLPFKYILLKFSSILSGAISILSLCLYIAKKINFFSFRMLVLLSSILGLFYFRVIYFCIFLN